MRRPERCATCSGRHLNARSCRFLRVARDSPRAPLQRGGGRVCASRRRTLGGTNRPSRCSSTGYTPRCLPRRIERTSNPEDLGTNGWNEKQELTTVVLIHGLWMTPLSWEHWVARYQGQGLRVIAPGYPGIKPGRGRGRAQSPKGTLSKPLYTAPMTARILTRVSTS